MCKKLIDRRLIDYYNGFAKSKDLEIEQDGEALTTILNINDII